ncbi:MAG: porin, partial [Polyangiales bacterium]
MRFCLRSFLVLTVLGSASAVLAEDPDAGVKSAPAARDAEKPSAQDKHPRLVVPKGDGEDNAQLGGEPSLTEGERAETTAGDSARTPSPDEASESEDCDLDCLEAQEREAEERERQRQSTLEIGEETGSIQEDVQADSGDVLAAEPSTTSLAQAQQNIAQAHQLPTRLGPVRIRVGETNDWIGIGFAMQLEFDYLQQYAGGGETKSHSETLEFRRIRTTVSSSFIEGRIRTSFQLNLTPSSLELIDMWLAFTRAKFATLRVGQFKIPYDRYRAQSFAALSFIDWAPTTRMFGSERQIGAEVLATGGFWKLEYAAGIFTGVNARAAHAVGISYVYGVTPPNPSALGSGTVVSEFHPALVGRVAKNFGSINTDTNSDATREKQLRQSVGAGVAWDARPTPTLDLGLRLSAEWLAKIRGFHINVISYLAWFPPWQGGKILFGPIGFMGEVGYRFSLLWELAIRYSSTYLTPWLRSDAQSYGQAQIANSSDPDSAQAQFGQNG